MPLATAIKTAPVTVDKKIFGIISPVKTFSRTPTKIVVRVDPTKVLIAILFPNTKNAVTSNKQFIITRIVPGEMDMYAFKITDIPLVPPRSNECGNIKATVEKAYIMLPKTINK